MQPDFRAGDTIGLFYIVSDSGDRFARRRPQPARSTSPAHDLTRRGPHTSVPRIQWLIAPQHDGVAERVNTAP
ncbi:MAG TPA: hypothetical protein VFY36_06045 [Solirubrobacteraceae bacterium]|nr:hypothetical protein [Solirubrobacteraceae bacterium]